jgi:acetylornithine/succinyldiaminopimelate/putrescine aminotransferase
MTVPAGPGVVRWLSPLNINQIEASEALGIMKAVLTALE